MSGVLLALDRYRSAIEQRVLLQDDPKWQHGGSHALRERLDRALAREAALRSEVLELVLQEDARG